MKLLRQIAGGWEYELNRQEALCLRSLIQQFPLTPATPARITRTESGDQVDERETMLNESLAEHRTELGRTARSFLTAGQLTACQDGWRLRLNVVEREILLQLLNDIRVETWRALGEPESLEAMPAPTPGAGPNFRALMHLAGFFEFELLNLEAGDHQPG